MLLIGVVGEVLRGREQEWCGFGGRGRFVWMVLVLFGQDQFVVVGMMQMVEVVVVLDQDFVVVFEQGFVVDYFFGWYYVYWVVVQGECFGVQQYSSLSVYYCLDLCEG